MKRGYVAYKVGLALIPNLGGYDREEHENGIISIAAPILTSTSQVVGAISIVTSTSRHSIEDLQEHKAALLATAKTIADEAELYLQPTNHH